MSYALLHHERAWLGDQERQNRSAVTKTAASMKKTAAPSVNERP